MKWEDNRDWKEKFFDPHKKPKEGESPIKDCPECGYLNHASVKECAECGHIFKKEIEQKDNEEVVLRQVSDSRKVTDAYADDLIKRLYNNIDFGNKPHKLVHDIQDELIKEELKNYRVDKFLKNEEQIKKDLYKLFRSRYKVLYDYDKKTFRDFNVHKYWKEHLNNKLSKRFKTS
jgi:hypothetical protein